MKIGEKFSKLINRRGNGPSFLLPAWLAGHANHVHNGSVSQGVMEQRPVKTNEHGIRNLRDAGRHFRHRQERTKCDLTCVVHHFISEDTGSYFRGTAVTTNQDITCICFPVCERRHNMIRTLRESLETMVEEHAIGIVSN